MPASARPLVFSDVTGTCAVELVKFPVVVGIDVTFSTFEVGDVIMEENTDTEEVGPCVSEVELPVVDDDVIDELAVVCDVRIKCWESAVVVVDWSVIEDGVDDCCVDDCCVDVVSSVVVVGKVVVVGVVAGVVVVDVVVGMSILHFNRIVSISTLERFWLVAVFTNISYTLSANHGGHGAQSKSGCTQYAMLSKSHAVLAHLIWNDKKSNLK